MLKKTTSWDEALLRKFSSTGHYRLLHQLRSELKAQPLIRDSESRQLTLQSMTIRTGNPRISRRPNALDSNEGDNSLVANANELPSSFRDRLNAIQMR